MKIIKIPVNSGAMSKGAGQEKAPEVVIDKLKDFYLKENGFFPVIAIENLEIDNSDIEKTNSLIEQRIKRLDVPAIILGGDHSLTYSTFKGFSQRYENPGLVVFDAHLDCVNEFNPPTHEDYLKTLINEGILKKENVVVVGARNIYSKELDFVNKNKIKVFDMREITHEGKREVCDSIMSVAKQFDGLYLSIDIDVLDPAFAPGTGYIEPGGLTSRELLYFIQRLKNLKNLQMIDIVEINPGKDINDITLKTGAKLIIELC